MIAIVGLGVLGTRVLKALKKSEHVLLIDYDFIAKENIPRQYPKEFLGKSKVESAKELYHENSEILHTHLDCTTAGVLEDCELVIDCTDNMITRRVINDFCSREGIPWIHSALSDSAGTVATFIPNGSCFSCLYPSGTGETCSPRLDLKIADKTAAAVIEALTKLRNKVSTFIRISNTGNIVLEMEQRKDCQTCSGSYQHLKPMDFYITYCVNSSCMAAKPLKHVHDHGKPRELTIEGMPLELYPNGEIHFGAEADDDTLHSIAKLVYNKYRAH